MLNLVRRTFHKETLNTLVLHTIMLAYFPIYFPHQDGLVFEAFTIAYN